jgi:hypothetical protein
MFDRFASVAGTATISSRRYAATSRATTSADCSICVRVGAARSAPSFRSGKRSLRTCADELRRYQRYPSYPPYQP